MQHGSSGLLAGWLGGCSGRPRGLIISLPLPAVPSLTCLTNTRPPPTCLPAFMGKTNSLLKVLLWEEGVGEGYVRGEERNRWRREDFVSQRCNGYWEKRRYRRGLCERECMVEDNVEGRGGGYCRRKEMEDNVEGGGGQNVEGGGGYC
ncbi:hypothetical protein Pmani_030857 [Petrolisthes manimaculis]|uniref:Uncharacterized protein n=1 Tax=Petrolisthes manimaculis TaxID=1843537 RepID=A0AAE1NVT6_9EUCA|nr:hypothetical protein Pmani_030857 [Petrolisthes manimaculis]